MELIFASNNQHKLSEIRKVLPQSFKIIQMYDAGIMADLPETGTTLQENALQKASFVFEAIGKNCFADDTGLIVDALGGQPGVYSARYAGNQCSAEDNIEKLLSELKSKSDRSALFKTVIAAIINGKQFVFEGQVRGTIAHAPVGQKGFGYDPVFIPEGESETFAQMSKAKKNKISHRAKAIQAFISGLKSL